MVGIPGLQHQEPKNAEQMPGVNRSCHASHVSLSKRNDTNKQMIKAALKHIGCVWVCVHRHKDTCVCRGPCIQLNESYMRAAHLQHNRVWLLQVDCYYCR